MASFINMVADWLSKKFASELSTYLRAALSNEMEDNHITDPAKLIAGALPVVTHVALHKMARGPQFDSWVDATFQKLGRSVNPYEDLDLDRIYIDVVNMKKDEAMQLSGRYIGSEQEPDTEVPQHLSTNDLAKMFKNLGATKTTVDWLIKTVEVGYGQTALHTTYSFTVTFPMKTLGSLLFDKERLAKEADRTLNPPPPPEPKKPVIKGRMDNSVDLHTLVGDLRSLVEEG